MQQPSPILGIDAAATDRHRRAALDEDLLAAVASIPWTPAGGALEVSLGACDRAIVLGADGLVEAVVIYDRPLDYMLAEQLEAQVI